MVGLELIHELTICFCVLRCCEDLGHVDGFGFEGSQRK